MQAEYETSDFIGALSTRVSDNPSHGHYFWTYNAVHQNQSGKGLQVPTVIGPAIANAEFIEPFLKRTLSKNEFRVNPLLLLSYKLGRLSRLINKRRAEGIERYFLYDGGLSDYVMVSWLAMRNPRVHFTFNFHWADQWMSLLRSRKIPAIMTRALIRWTIREAPHNVRFSAETKPFARELESVFGHEFSVFPIFSTTVPQSYRPWNSRTVDVLFLPQRKTEMDFVARASSLLERNGVSVATALKLETWTRWTNRESLNTPESPTFLPLGAKEYEELLSSSRVVVLPYDKPYFRWGSSGKFNEAIAHGCFPLVPQGTAIASQSSGESALHEFIYPDEESLVEVVTRVLSNPTIADLVPILLTDFLGWMARPELPEAKKLQLNSVVAHVFLLLAASTYRDPGIMTRSRKVISAARRKIADK